MTEQEDNSTSIEIRIATTVTSGIGALIAGTILVLVLTNRAYKSILQRLFMWIILAILIHDIFRFGGFYKDFSHGQTQIQLLKDEACEILSFLTVWAHWCQYLFCMDTILYLLVIVCIQTRDNPAFVMKVRTSKPLRRLLELAVIFATIFLPLVILWVPFITGNYGFSGSVCGLKKHRENPANQNISSIQDFAVTSIFKYAVIGLTIAATMFSTLAITIVYYTLPAKYLHAKNLVRNILILFVCFVVFLLIYSTIQGLFSLYRGVELKIFSLCLDIAGKFVLLVGYILDFHFTKLCEPIRKLFSFKKPEPHQQQEAAPLQEQEEVNKYESVEKKQSGVTPETRFTIRHTGEFTSALPTAE